MKTLIVAAWWILVQYPYFGNDAERAIPRALGPYPSHELCRIAGTALMPNDRQFWTKAETEKREAEDKAASERYEQAKRTAIAEAMKRRGYKAGDRIDVPGYATALYLNQKGEVTNQVWVTSGGMSTYSIPPTALTGCVSISDGPKQ